VRKAVAVSLVELSVVLAYTGLAVSLLAMLWVLRAACRKVVSARPVKKKGAKRQQVTRSYPRLSVDTRQLEKDAAGGGVCSVSFNETRRESRERRGNQDPG
jgi:hypothetical protein